MRRAYAAVLAVILLGAAGCREDEEPPPPGPSVSVEASISKAWIGDVAVRPDLIGRDAPWIWEYSDDVVVIAERALVALDRATGVEVWRLPVGGEICGATPEPSELGLVAVTVGKCQADRMATRAGPGDWTGGPATARRTTVKAVDLESASIVWERPSLKAPQLEIGGETLAVVDTCRTRRLSLSDGRTLSREGFGCNDSVLAADGVMIATAQETPQTWRVVDIESGESSEVKAGDTNSPPYSIIEADPLTVTTAGSLIGQQSLVRVEDSQARVLGEIERGKIVRGSVRDGSVVVEREDAPGGVEVSLDDGSTLGEITTISSESWIPVGRFGDSVLGFEGSSEELLAGTGVLNLRSLADDSVIEVGKFSAGNFLGDTNFVVAGPKAVIIDDILLMPSHANAQVLAYRLVLPD